MALQFPRVLAGPRYSPHGQIATYDPNAVISDAFEHDPGAQHREQDAGEEAPASPVSGPCKVDRFADGDLIPPHRHEKSRLTVPLTSCALSQPDCRTADPYVRTPCPSFVIVRPRR